MTPRPVVMAARKNKAAVALGRKGGSATSEAKAEASRENGKKGGRPKKAKRTRALTARRIE